MSTDVTDEDMARIKKWLDDHDQCRDDVLVVPLWAGPDASDTPEINIQLYGRHVVVQVNRAMRELARTTDT